ncbi:MAG: nucleotidyltransferase domain-containing protein [Coleofasciculaceae cyanobacterium RL_1_1]|nr:nucleotidyltransferase domain-containing protein [Coleofasciculaceae cyanobacterium RL_1_1]
MQNPKLQVILDRVKQELINHYQDALESVILYGSQARDDAKNSSDIDLLIILNSLMHPCDEIDETADFITQVCLDYDVVISWQFISLEQFQYQESPFLFNVKREGILV